MANQLCVDSSVVLKLVLSEEHSDRARALWASWVADEVEVIAPFHLAFEVTSVIRNRVYRGEISPQVGEWAFTAIHAQDIRLAHPAGLLERAWQLSQQFSRPMAYDTAYLALAELRGCALWTADKRLYRAVQGDLAWVHWLGSYS